MLFISEARRCFKVELKQQMDVHATIEPTLHVEFNITFPALPCRAIRLDAGDVGGRFETESMMEVAK